MYSVQEYKFLNSISNYKYNIIIIAIIISIVIIMPSLKAWNFFSPLN